MISRKYKAFEKQETRAFKKGPMIVSLIALLFFGSLTFVLYDLNRNPESIDESNNKAVLGEFIPKTDEYKVVETTSYSMRIPKDWIQINSPEVIVNGGRFYPERYQGITGDNVGRRIDVYSSEIPNLVVDKVLKIEANGASVSVGNISQQCLSFTDLLDPESHQSTQAEWDGLSFLCSMTQNSDIILAADTETTEGVYLKGDKTADKYMFIFADHGSHQDNTIFQKILRSFRVK